MSSINIEELLNNLITESRTQRKDTQILGIKVQPPWANEDWKGINFYNSHDDDDVTDKDALVVKYMTGSKIPPHITMSLIDGHYIDRLNAFRESVSKALSQVKLKCDGVHCFPQTSASKALGAKGFAVVMIMSVPHELHMIRNAAGIIPTPREFFRGIANGESLWKPHVTVGYVSDDKQKTALMERLEKYVGQDVDILGWF